MKIDLNLNKTEPPEIIPLFLEKINYIDSLLACLQAVRVNINETASLDTPKYERVFSPAEEVNFKDKILEIVAGM